MTKAWTVLIALPLLAGARPYADMPSERAMDAARRAHLCAVAADEVRSSIVTLIDYSRPATEKRLWVIDLANDDVLLYERVTHGKNSGWNRTTRFSNEPESLASSLGVFRIGAEYSGKHGPSLRLQGLEPGFNDNAFRRAVVIHGAAYADRVIAHRRYGRRLGRSWGCPAVRPEVVEDLIALVRGGTLLVGYADDDDWLTRSAYLNCAS